MHQLYLEMKITRNAVLVGIGAILVLALAGVPIQNAEAIDSTMLQKLQSIQNDVESLKESSKNFDASKIGSNSFKFSSVGDDLLEIKNDSGIDSNYKETSSVIIEYLISEYKTAFNEYKSQVEKHDRINSVDMKQKQIMKKLVQDFIDFETVDEDYNKLSSDKETMASEITRVENEEKFQKYINKIAIKITDSNNGNKVQKIFHEVALQKVVEEENWKLVAPAMDRIITQYSNPEIKQHLETYKEKVIYLIQSLERSQQTQPEVLALTNDIGAKTPVFNIVFGNENEILTSSIISAQLQDEIKSIISDSQKIVKDENNRIQEYVEIQREQARQNDDDNIVELETSDPEPESEPESEPEPENHGNGNGNGNNANGNNNGNSNGNENSSSNGNENKKGNDNDKDDSGGGDNDKGSNNANGNENGKDNGKGKSKTA